MSLFDASPENACLAYSNIRASANAKTEAARKHCECLWKDFEPLADDHFLNEFPLHLHERWFEMYLTVTLMRAGFTIQSTNHGPDILLISNGRRIWIEAVCATAGEEGKPDTVPQPVYSEIGEDPVVTNQPTDQIVLRVRNALHAKEKKFIEYRTKGIVAQNDLTLIAINIHAIPYAWMDLNDFMRRTLYGLGNLTITIDQRTLQVTDQKYEERSSISKTTGNSVSVQPFVDRSMAHISGVLGSWEDCVNLAKNPGDGFVIYPNLSAENPWPKKTLNFGDEWIFDPAVSTLKKHSSA